MRSKVRQSREADKQAFVLVQIICISVRLGITSILIRHCPPENFYSSAAANTIPAIVLGHFRRVPVLLKDNYDCIRLNCTQGRLQARDHHGGLRRTRSSSRRPQ